MKKVLIFMLALLISMPLFAQDATEIIKKVDDKIQGNSTYSTMSMSIVRPKYTRTIEFKSWTLGDNYAMTYISAPAKDKGQVFLKLQTEMWNFMPSINRMIKLPPSMMSQGWMGSDYSNDEVVKQSSIVSDYTHTYINLVTIGDVRCHKIELIPNQDANIVWGKVIMYIEEDNFIVRRAKYFDNQNELVRTEDGSIMKTFDGITIYSKVQITPADEPENKTIINILSMEYNIEIEEDFFSQQNMKKIK